MDNAQNKKRALPLYRRDLQGRSLFYKLFAVLFLLSLIPTLVVSIFIVSAYSSILQEYAPDTLARISEDISMLVLLLIPSSAIFISFAAFALSRAIMRPVQTLADAMRKVSAGDLAAQIKITRQDELGGVFEFFNLMVETLRDARDRHRMISRLKSKFVSVAAHQLRTPLSAIKWTLKIILDEELGALNQEQHKFLQKGYEANERMIRLINDMLNVSRIEEGKFSFTFTDILVIPLFEGVARAFAPLAQKRNVSMNINARLPRTAKVIADPDRLRLAVSNIISNAVQYNKEGGSVTITIERVDEFVKISIADTGIGIPENELDKISSRFYRASNAVKLQTEGSGLGLFITRNIIRRHGGTTAIISKENVGTTFSFTLPTRNGLIPEETAAVEDFLEAM